MGRNIGIKTFPAMAALLVVGAALLVSTGQGGRFAQAQEITNRPDPREPIDLPNSFERDLISALERITDDSQTSREIAAGEPVTQNRNPNTGQLLPSFVVQRQVDAQGGSRVPILVPYIWTYSSSVARANQFKIKAKPTHYTAIFRPPSMPGPVAVVIDGSIDFIQSEKRVSTRATEPYPFDTLGEARGGSITFSKFGASYLVQFHCRDGLELEAPSCITADVARNFVLRELLGEVQ